MWRLRRRFVEVLRRARRGRRIGISLKRELNGGGMVV